MIRILEPNEKITIYEAQGIYNQVNREFGKVQKNYSSILGKFFKKAQNHEYKDLLCNLLSALISVSGNPILEKQKLDGFNHDAVTKLTTDITDYIHERKTFF